MFTVKGEDTMPGCDPPLASPPRKCSHRKEKIIEETITVYRNHGLTYMEAKMMLGFTLEKIKTLSRDALL